MQKTTLQFRPSSSDYVEHRVRILNAGSEFDYSIAYSRIVRKLEVPIVINEGEVAYVTTVDRAGNESDQLLVRNSMAKLNSKTLRFTPSASPDEVGYRIRIAKDGEAFSYDLPFSFIPATEDANGKIVADIGSLSVAPAQEGVYDVYVTAVDAAENESDPMIIENASFDFNPPEAPTDGEIV